MDTNLITFNSSRMFRGTLGFCFSCNKRWNSSVCCNELPSSVHNLFFPFPSTAWSRECSFLRRKDMDQESTSCWGQFAFPPAGCFDDGLMPRQWLSSPVESLFATCFVVLPWDAPEPSLLLLWQSWPLWDSTKRCLGKTGGSGTRRVCWGSRCCLD